MVGVVLGEFLADDFPIRKKNGKHIRNEYETYLKYYWSIGKINTQSLGDELRFR